MIGIYLITNKVNGHSYVGQSRDIKTRWLSHKEDALNPNSSSYKYPLQCAMRKYGMNNFSFTVLEESTVEELNKLESFWIQKLKPEYNQTIGGDYQVVPQKLTYDQVQEIQNILLKDKDGNVSHKDLAEKYGVSKDTIRDINVGRTWIRSDVTYPLHYSKFDALNPKIKKSCIDCGKPISKNATRCNSCENKRRNTENIKQMAVTREKLKQLLRTKSFVEIGRMYGCTDNAVRKWCDKYGLPRKVKEIKSYSDEEWDKI